MHRLMTVDGLGLWFVQRGTFCAHAVSSDMPRSTRRGFLGALAAGSASLAGCQVRTGTTTQPATSGQVEIPDDVDGRFTEVIADTIGSVALLRVLGETQRQGSAFVYDTNHLVTNQHVIEGGQHIDVRYTDNDWTTGTVVGADTRSDLAVVRVEDRPPYASPVSLIEGQPAIGREVLALGNPLGFDDSVSAGIVSATGRSIPVSEDVSLPNAVQTDAALNPGNSGGPLVNLDSQVVAVISVGAGQGIGFGISAALMRRVIPALIEDGVYRHSYMGVGIQDVSPRIATANGLSSVGGVYVLDTFPDTPAADGLVGSDRTTTIDGVSVPVGGDVIVALDGEPIEVTADLSAYLALETSPGDTIEVSVIRDGIEQTVELTLAARNQFD